MAGIQERIAGALADARALESLARSARGDDAWALRIDAAQSRLSAVDELDELADAVEELAAKDVEVASHRRRLEELVPRAVAATRRLVDSIDTVSGEVAKELESAGGREATELERRLGQLDDLRERSLEAAVEQVALLERLGLPTDATRSWLVERVHRRARLTAARIHLWADRRAHAAAASDDSPDDAELAKAAIAAAAQYQHHVDALAATVPMMDALEMDATSYRQLVVESSGQISTEVFDRRVAEQLVSRWTSNAMTSLAENGPGLILETLVFLLLVIVFWSLARFVRGVTERALESSRVRLSQLLKRILVSIASGSVLFIGLLIAFSQMGIEIGPMLAGLGIAGFVLGFALQDSLSNFASGIMILAYRPYDVQDLIECAGGVFGRVSQMNLVSTTILTIDNQTRVVPNSKIWGDVITNVTAQQVRRVDLVFGVSYSDDIPKTEAILTAILEEHPKVLDEPAYTVRLHELGDSSVNFVVRPWVQRDDYWDVFWDVTREVKMRFDREGISIPFPQRDVHLFREETAAAEVGPE